MKRRNKAWIAGILLFTLSSYIFVWLAYYADEVGADGNIVLSLILGAFIAAKVMDDIDPKHRNNGN